MNELNSFFKKLGLTDEETAVYLFLLQNGISTIFDISKGIGINRTNLYRLCERLTSEGFLKKLSDKGTTKYEAASVEYLKLKVDDIERRVNDIRAKFNSVKNKFQRISQLQDHKIRVVHYQGKEEVKQLLWNYLETRGEALSFGYRTLSEMVGRNFVIKWWNEAKRRGIRDRILANPGTFELKDTIDNKSRDKLIYDQWVKVEEREIDEKIFKIYYETFIYNDIFSIVQWDENLAFGVEIQNEEISRFKRREFEILWKLGKHYKG
ncbi:MAG: helix-turn-helix domain-containing protein [Patescibacteria group bacterium]|nr:hypothetical protein [Patescibacteria group bacterium]